MKLYNVRVIAHLLDLSETRIRQLRDEGVINEIIPGHYKLVETVQQYVRYLRRGNQTEEGQADYKTEQALFMRAKRQNEEFDLQLRSQELHYSVDVEKVCLQLLLNFKQRLLGLPSKLAHLLSEKDDPNDIQDILTRETKEILEELADFQKIVDLLEGEVL